MKKVMMLIVAVLTITAVQAQEEVKNSYIDNGDVIEATLYYDNGEVSQTGFYTKEGKLTGEWISYNREGEETAKAQYDNGAKVGMWLFWNDNSLSEVSYADSKIESVKTWKSENVRVVSK